MRLGYITTIVRKYKATGFRYEFVFHINAVEVLRKRPDAVIPCNPDIHDEDSLWRHTVISSVGCIPPFMQRFVVNATFPNKPPISRICNRTQYRNISKQYKIDMFYSVAKLYAEPCNQMTSIVTMDNTIITEKNNTENRKVFAIVINYETREYKETINNKAFSITTLWSQIGGFIGIFLGYSLLQVPEVVATLIASVKTLFKSHNRNRTGPSQTFEINENAAGIEETHVHERTSASTS